ncbi:uncharacterized protein LOC115627696 [Scaptodrosophila lebanonensis]|uniref:Uncharacterized protein LOC115627696 n=1 Tax=Drosophila lebanonensis TaxID=7225 RepID=A0A6J2TVX0_DROLE|nr:uncharacterized protein LOC115627696 [Scaptodrosophila lebanonensis]
MADEKHRMLFQGQDPLGQDPELSVRSAILGPTSTDDVQQLAALPPTYDDAMASAPHYATFNFAHADRRRTFFAEPQHFRSGLPYVLGAEQPSMTLNNENTVRLQPLPLMAQDVHDVHDVQDAPSQHMFGRVPMPQVRTFFSLAPQPKLGIHPSTIVCPACGQQGLTRLQRSPNSRTHSWALWLCSLGWCCCACICPYLIDSCRTTSHYCATCQTFLGAHYPKSSTTTTATEAQHGRCFCNHYCAIVRVNAGGDGGGVGGGAGGGSNAHVDASSGNDAISVATQDARTLMKRDVSATDNNNNNSNSKKRDQEDVNGDEHENADDDDDDDDDDEAVVGEEANPQSHQRQLKHFKDFDFTAYDNDFNLQEEASIPEDIFDQRHIPNGNDDHSGSNNNNNNHHNNKNMGE